MKFCGCCFNIVDPGGIRPEKICGLRAHQLGDAQLLGCALPGNIRLGLLNNQCNFMIPCCQLVLDPNDCLINVQLQSNKFLLNQNQLARVVIKVHSRVLGFAVDLLRSFLQVTPQLLRVKSNPVGSSITRGNSFYDHHLYQLLGRKRPGTGILFCRIGYF